MGFFALHFSPTTEFELALECGGVAFQLELLYTRLVPMTGESVYLRFNCKISTAMCVRAISASLRH